MDPFGTNAIVGFRGQNSWLSTWTRNPVMGFPTMEHAYQALKSPDKAEEIRKIDHPKNIPRVVVLGFDREAGLRTVIREAFRIASPMAGRLLATGDKLLVSTEDVWRGFHIARNGYIRGYNLYGKLLMEHREFLRAQVAKIVPMQRRWREALVNPAYEICRRVCAKEFDEISKELSKRAIA